MSSFNETTQLAFVMFTYNRKNFSVSDALNAYSSILIKKYFVVWLLIVYVHLTAYEKVPVFVSLKDQD